MNDLELAALERYLAAEATPEDQARLEAWLRANPAHRAVVGAFEQLQGSVTRSASGFEVERLLAAVDGYTADSPQRHMSDRTLGPRPRQQRSLWMLWPVFAMIAIVVSAVLVRWPLRWLHIARKSTPAMETYVTGNGQRASITLADGTTVALDVASRLDVPADYSAGDHTVRLTGEALFTVLHHDRTPFAVQANGATVHVLGTSFVVRNYTTDSALTVAVREGKVSVSSTVVAAAQEVQVGQRGVGPIHPADPAQFGFADGVLVLNFVPLAQAIQDLDRWYDVDIQLGDQTLGTQPVTARLRAGSWTDLTTLLTLTFHVRVVRNGRILTLFPK